MSIIQKHARILEIMSWLFGIGLIVLTAGKWLFGWLPPSANSLIASLCYNFDTETVSLMTTIPWLQRLLGLTVDGIAVGIACLGIIQFIGLCKQLRTGEFFSPLIAKQFHRLSMFALSWALYNPLRTMLLSLITSLHKGPGNRVITLSVGTNDIINIAIFSSFVLLTALIQEGSKLKQEHDLTV